MRAEHIAQMPMAELLGLRDEIGIKYALAKEHKEIFDQALDIRYSQKAIDLLQNNGQNTGTIHFSDEAYTVSAVIPKKVNWDQEKIEGIIQGMSYEQRKQYIEISYKVHEQKYLVHCPSGLREQLETAREVVIGKPKFTIKA